MFIHYNRKFKRYEVYSFKSVVRNDELQPVFVSADRDRALAFARVARG